MCQTDTAYGIGHGYA